MDNESEYYVNNAKQIVSYLNQLQQKNCLITAHFGENNESFMTTLIQVDSKKRLVVLDAGPKEYLNKQLLQSLNPGFRTEIDGIKVAFSAKKVSSSRFKGQPAFVIPLPDSLFWMQRRQFYRQRVPMSHQSFCTLSFTDEENKITQKQFRLQDLSISGVAFVNEDIELSNQLIPTTAFDNCTLQLQDTLIEGLDLIIKNKFNLIHNKPEKGQRVGCELGHLTQAIESAIQRYLQEIQRESRTTQ